MPTERLSRQAQRCLRLLAGDGGEVAKKLGQGSFAVEVVDQHRHRDPCPIENDRAAHDLEVPPERDRVAFGHCLGYPPKCK